jgi:alkylation response protein AidB-like acyl-CoA dehydrogenase
MKATDDWNTFSDEDFRRIVRAEFVDHYPTELRYPARRLRWAENRDWYLRMARKGWIAPNWPRAFGGMGLAARKLLIFSEEQERWGIGRYQDHGVLMIGPLLIQYGTSEQRDRFLPPILACEHIWCQGYSEPNAGSDLASLRTRAQLNGDLFVINGQKIWTTLAQDATHIFLLVRTDPAAKPQKGISFILADMRSPGITIRPIRDIAGHEEFCEVFFDRVEVPRENLVGAMNEGWGVAKSLLGFERVSLGSPKLPEYGLQILTTIARLRGVIDQPVFRDRFTETELDVVHLADLYEGYAEKLVRGEVLGPDVSCLKIVATDTFQRIADLILETAGSFACLKGNVTIGEETLNILGSFYKSRTATIYGGSNEIQRNIIAKQVLNLPTK